MMRTSRLLGLALAALLLSSLVLPLSAYAARQEQTKAEKFIEIAQRANEQAVKLRDQAKDRGVDVTAASNLIDEGETLLKEAKASLDKSDYATAFEKARGAQAKFRDAIKALGVSAGEAEEEKGKGILVAIDRAKERIQRLKDVLTGITPTPENQMYIDWVKGNLTEAEKNLADAKAAVEKKPADVATASKLLGEANKNIEEAFKALKLIGDWTVTWRSENFLNGIKKQLERVKDQLDRLAEKGIQVDDLKAKLSNVEGLIQKARSKVFAGDKKGALSDMKEAREILHEIMKDLAKRHKPEKPGEGRGKP